MYLCGSIWSLSCMSLMIIISGVTYIIQRIIHTYLNDNELTSCMHKEGLTLY